MEKRYHLGGEEILLHGYLPRPMTPTDVKASVVILGSELGDYRQPRSGDMRCMIDDIDRIQKTPAARSADIQALITSVLKTWDLVSSAARRTR